MNQVGFHPRRNTRSIPLAQQCERIRLAQREPIHKHRRDMIRRAMPVLTAEGDGEDEEAEARNYAKELKDELKELKNSIATQLDRIKTLKSGRKEKESITAAENAGKDTTALRAELALLETEIAPVLAEMNDIKARLVPYEEICDRLSAARKKLRALEEALLECLESARGVLTADQVRELVLDLSREALVRVLSAGVTAHRQQVIAAVENLWDKYQVSLTAREQTRANVGGRLGDMLKELGYA